MHQKTVNKAELIKTLPPERDEDLMPRIRELLQAKQCKLVVLDDDPTGTQTVHQVPVLTEWSVDTLRRELENDKPTFYLLTNSRSLPEAQARDLNAEIAKNLTQAAKLAGRKFDVVSRGDSTLRGHFPGEVQALADGLGCHFDGWLNIPFFLEGNRFTVNDVHYVAAGQEFVPVGETEFAKDSAFGFRSSNLREWVEEKTAGSSRAEDVLSISLEDIRIGGPEKVKERLFGPTDGRICIVNVLTMQDMRVFVLGLLMAEAQGKRFLYRTSASFVQTRAGLIARPLLTAEELNLGSKGGGLTIVGSYVPKTTSQLKTLLSQTGTMGIEVSTDALLNIDDRAAEIERVACCANEALHKNQDVVMYTARALKLGRDAKGSLSIGNHISNGLVSILRKISAPLRYIIAKGGITSSDMATHGLNVKRAMVLGQICPGVPVWSLGPESARPGLSYIVFPGNVGTEQTLADTVKQLQRG